MVKPTDYRLTQPLEQPLLVVTDAAAPHGLSATSARTIQMSPERSSNLKQLLVQMHSCVSDSAGAAAQRADGERPSARNVHNFAYGFGLARPSWP